MPDTDTIEDVGTDAGDQQPEQPQPPDKLKALYDAVGKQYDLGTIDEFRQKMSDQSKRKAFYDYVGKEYDLGKDFNEFSSKLGASATPPASTSAVWQRVQEAVDPELLDAQNERSDYARKTQIPELISSEQADRAFSKLTHDKMDQVVNGKRIPALEDDSFKAGKAVYTDFLDYTSPQTRSAMTEAKRLAQAKGDSDFVNKVNAAYYAIDFKDQDPEKSKDVYNQIKSGQLGYDLLAKRPTKELGPMASLVNEHNEHVRLLKRSTEIDTTPKDQMINNLENARLAVDPNEPIPKSSSAMSSVAGWFGSQATNALDIAAGTALTVATEGVAAPELGAAVSALLMGTDAAKSSHASTFENTYYSLRRRGIEKSEAYDEAMRQANISAGLSAAQMAYLSYGANKLGSDIYKAAGIGKNLKGKAINELKAYGDKLPEIVSETTKQALFAGAMKAGENFSQGKPVTQDLDMTVLGTAAQLAVMHKIAGHSDEYTPRERTAVVNDFSKMNPEYNDALLKQLYEYNHITPEQYQSTRQEISDAAELNQGLPHDNVPQENKQKIQNRLRKIDALEYSMSSENPRPVHKAWHAQIREKIKGLEEEVEQLSKPDRGFQAGDYVQWQSQGADQFAEPRPISHLSEEGTHAFFEGSETGVPVEDLKMSRKPTVADDLTPGKGQSIAPEYENIHPDEKIRTMDMGTDEGKPETKEARKQMQERFLQGDVPIDGEGGKGETARGFASRVLGRWLEIKDNEAAHTTLVTSSSALKAVKSWENPETWKGVEKPTDPSAMSPEQWEAFAKQFNGESTENGDLETFEGKNGDIHVIRHGQTQDNLDHNFRKADTNLTEKGIEDARDAAKNLKTKIGDQVPKIISSDLPRTIHSSNIIMDELSGKLGDKNQKVSDIEPANEEAIKKATRPNIDFKDIPEEAFDRVNATKMASAVEIYNDATRSMRSLQKIVNCIWGT